MVTKTTGNELSLFSRFFPTWGNKTDNNMPGMTGLELVEQVVGLRPELPVLLISGLADNLDPAEARALGISRVLPKPHGTAELHAAVRELLPNVALDQHARR